MAKQRPYRPKGHSSSRPQSGQRPQSGPRPGGSGPRPRPGGGTGHGPAPRRHPAGGPQAHGPHRSGSKPGPGQDRSARTRSGAAEPRPRTNIEPGKPERLQKILAQAGLGSRRGCEELILQGRVTVEGQVVRELGTKVDPAAKIAVDGEADPAGADGLSRRQQARGLRLDQQRPFGPPPGGRPRPRDPRAGLYRRTARRGQYRADDPDQRRRAGQPAGASAVRRREAVPGTRRRPARPRNARPS